MGFLGVKMRSKFAIAGLVLAGAMSLFAQDSETHMPVTLGLKVGVPITDMFSANNVGYLNGSLPGSTYNASSPKYILGVSGEFHLYKRFRLEVDGLYKRTGFSTSGLYGSTGSNFYQSTGANVWEVPALLKTNITLGRIRPFVDFGASLRHISSIQNNEFLPGLVSGIITDNVDGLHNRNSYGGVAGIGITFKRGPIELSPEVRYTRWANESFQINGLRSNLDQGDFLLGISF
jgi:outer membrane protein with beta-barrel domain